MTASTSRRAVLAGAASLPALAVAVPCASASADEISELWKQRTRVLAARGAAEKQELAAIDRQPAWAKYGPVCIDDRGRPRGHNSGWPQLEDSPAPAPSGVWRQVRWSVEDARKKCRPQLSHLDMNDPEDAELWRESWAKYRAMMRKIIARIRQQRALLIEAQAFDDEWTRLDDELTELNGRIMEMASSGEFNALGAYILIHRDDHRGCVGEDFGLYAAVLKTILPHLSGSIAQAAAVALVEDANRPAEVEDERPTHSPDGIPLYSGWREYDAARAAREGAVQS